MKIIYDFMVYLAHLHPIEEHKNGTSNYSMHRNKLNLKELEFSVKIKHIPKFDNFNDLNVNVFELSGTVLIPIHKNTNYDQTQIDLMLYERLHCLVNIKLHT